MEAVQPVQEANSQISRSRKEVHSIVHEEGKNAAEAWQPTARSCSLESEVSTGCHELSLLLF